MQNIDGEISWRLPGGLRLHLEDNIKLDTLIAGLTIISSAHITILHYLLYGPVLMSYHQCMSYYGVHVSYKFCYAAVFCGEI
jgi:hypothetical protein